MSSRRRKTGGWRWLLWAVVAGLGLWLAWTAWTWPDVAALARRNPTTTAYIDQYRRTRGRAGRPAPVAWTWVPYGSVSAELKRAVLVAEDVNFFSHHGFDLGEIRHVLEQAVDEGELRRGASTITQQLARNLWLSPSRNPVRKVQEAILTWQLERALDKRRILELYLNIVELGPGIYGVGAGSRHYFAKAPADVGSEEAALLAASLPNPTAWHPGSSSRAYRRHAERIARRMARAEFLAKRI